MNETRPLSIYLHWPFCGSKCPYCDFNSHVRPQIQEERWVAAILAALGYWRAQTGDRRVATVFWGGGTPSLLSPGSVENVLNRIAKLWSVEDGCEITMEANPTTHEAVRFAGFRAAGVNRLSLGVQSFEQSTLDFLGRTYRVAEAKRALGHIAETFPRHSFDLIYALPGDRPEEWAKQLDYALTFAGEHLSLYQLTFEPGTRFFQALRAGRMQPLDDETAAELYELTTARLEERGLSAYEVSNFAAAGAECRHNLVYWTGGDWIGVGPGAHGRLGSGGDRRATAEWRSPERWLRECERGNGCEANSVLPKRAIGEELIMTGLRLAAGIDRVNFRRVTGESLDTFVSARKSARLVEEELAVSDSARFALTARGRQVLNSVLSYLLSG